MNIPSLVLGFIFLAMSLVFFRNARKAAGTPQQRSSRLAGSLFVLAGVAFFISFAVSAANAYSPGS